MSLVDKLLSPEPPEEPTPTRAAADGRWGEGFEWDGDKGTITIAPQAEAPGTWDNIIRAWGLDPAEVEVIEPVNARAWDAQRKGGDIVKLYYFRANIRRRSEVMKWVRGAIDRVRTHQAAPPAWSSPADSAFVIGIADMQLGKADGDGTEGTVARTLANIDAAAERYKAMRYRHPLGHIHVGWLGDHLEGFVSQGGANAWRTELPLSDQIELAAELMLYAVRVFAPLAPRVTMVAVPGNHGETVRFAGKGLTRYDDSFDTLALKQVAKIIRENPDAYGHVECFTPHKDELTYTLDVAGTRIGHMHGHQITGKGKHFDWWKGQALGDQPIGGADIILAGHLHALLIEQSSGRTFIRVPALESRSQWWKHRTGEIAAPGIVTLVAANGAWSDLAVIR